MTPAVRLCQELTADGVQLSVVNGSQLRYRRLKWALTWERKLLLKQFKSEIIELVTLADDDDTAMDAMAKQGGWLILNSGEAYSRQLSRTLTVFLLHDGKSQWQVWKGYWRKGESMPFAESTIAHGLLFDDALLRANEYVRYYLQKNRVS